MSSKSNKHAAKQAVAQPTPNSITRYWPWMAVGLILLVTAAIRIRLLNIPLERDEGEFAYMGQLMLKGIPPYELAYNMKFPGIYAAYALVMAIFGQSIAGVHLGLLLVNAISIVLVFLLAKRLIDPLAGVVAAAAFALMSVSQMVLGTSGHATQFVLPFALGGVLMLLRLRDSGRPADALWSGLLFGIAILMKQHAVLFAVFAVIYTAWTYAAKRPVDWGATVTRTGLMIAGITAPFVVTCGVLYAAGVFDKFWFWTFTYAREYVVEFTLSDGWVSFTHSFSRIFSVAVGLWVLAAIGMVVGIIAFRSETKTRGNMAFLGGFTLFSLLAVCPGLYFRNHYYIVALPAVAMLVGLAVSHTGRSLRQKTGMKAMHSVPLIVFLAVIAHSAYVQSDVLLKATPEQACQLIYTGNPFVESVEIAQYIKSRTNKNDRIAVVGSEPQIYFYSDRRSATGYIYTYGLMEKQAFASKMQREMIKEIEQARPKYFVFVNVAMSWLPSKDSDKTIFAWALEYTTDHYNLVGAIETTPDLEKYEYWGEDVQSWQPTTDTFICVFERKPGA